MAYAFEELGLRRVGFKTHHENLQSQAALRRLGAVYEGTFRNHSVMPDGESAAQPMVLDRAREEMAYSAIETRGPAESAGGGVASSVRLSCPQAAKMSRPRGRRVEGGNAGGKQGRVKSLDRLRGGFLEGHGGAGVPTQSG